MKLVLLLVTLGLSVSAMAQVRPKAIKLTVKRPLELKVINYFESFDLATGESLPTQLSVVNSCYRDGEFSEELTREEGYPTDGPWETYCCISASATVEGRDDKALLAGVVFKSDTSKRVLKDPWVKHSADSAPFIGFSKDWYGFEADLKIIQEQPGTRDLGFANISCYSGLMTRKSFDLKNVQHQFGNYIKVEAAD